MSGSERSLALGFSKAQNPHWAAPIFAKVTRTKSKAAAASGFRGSPSRVQFRPIAITENRWQGGEAHIR
jgi:hypothetical protein